MGSSTHNQMEAPNLYKEVGNLIRRQRRALDLTQAKLAETLGISRGALANIETGRQHILLHQMYRFAAALNLSVHEILPLANDVGLQELLTPANSTIELGPSKELPMPKGLTPEQKAQVAHVLRSTAKRRDTEEN
jgi:transcriptional regulator with XRE-family HTH domain